MSVNARFDEVKAWMQKHAPVIVNALAPPATEQDIAALEARLGFPVPAQLRELWLLHGGTEGENAFFGFLAFMGPSSIDTHDIMMFVKSDRELGKDDSVQEEELASEAWIPFAQQGYADGVAICGLTGRVFSWAKDSPAIELVASSLEAYLEQYAKALEDGEYELDEGFSEHGYYLAD